MPFIYNTTEIKFKKRNDVQTNLTTPKIPIGKPIHKKEYGEEKIFYAQNVYRKKDYKDSTYVGDAEKAIGHLCISKKDYDSLDDSQKISKYDKITSISGIQVDYKVCEIRPAGHISLWSSIKNHSQHSLYLIFYETDHSEKPVGLKSV